MKLRNLTSYLITLFVSVGVIYLLTYFFKKSFTVSGIADPVIGGLLLTFIVKSKSIYNILLINWDFLKPKEVKYENDDFAKHTVRVRFEQIYNRLGFHGKYKEMCEERLDFNYDDFSSIVPKGILQCDKSIDSLIIPFVETVSKFKNITKRKYIETAPFIEVEHFYYYDILVKNYQKHNKLIDPYSEIKSNDLSSDINSNKVKKLIEMYLSAKEVSGSTDFQNFRNHIDKFLINCLTSNSSDLSQWEGRLKHIDRLDGVLIDDRKQFLDFLEKNRVKELNIIVDNSGIELASDIFLSLVLLKLGLITKVFFHISVLPIFVSDTIMSEYGNDIDIVLNSIKKYNESVYTDIQDYIANDKIKWCPNMFWNMPNYFRHLPSELSTQLNSGGLVIVKGDLNYRRLVEDRFWKHNKSLKKHVDYFKTPFLLIRGLKFNVIMDVPKDVENKAKELDSEWMSSGRCGIIQFVIPD